MGPSNRRVLLARTDGGIMATTHLLALLAAALITLGAFAVTPRPAGALVLQTAQRVPFSPYGPSIPFTVLGATTACRWIRQFGTSAYDEAHAVAADASRIYVAGITGNPPGVFLRKYDLDGNLVWSQLGAGGDIFPQAVAVDDSGVYVAGYIQFPQDPSLNADAFLWKYDLDGNVVWIRTFGTPETDYANAVAGDASSVAVNESSVYVGGVIDVDAFLRKYDPDGNVVWTRRFSSQNGVGTYAVAFTGFSDYVAGYTQGALSNETSAGGYDAFVRKYDTDGTELWTHQFGTSGNDFAWGAAADRSSVYVAGVTDGTLPGQAR